MHGLTDKQKMILQWLTEHGGHWHRPSVIALALVHKDQAFNTDVAPMFVHSQLRAMVKMSMLETTMFKGHAQYRISGTGISCSDEPNSVCAEEL